MDRLKSRNFLRANCNEASDIGYLCEVTTDEEFIVPTPAELTRNTDVDSEEMSRISTISPEMKSKICERKSRILKRSENAFDSSDSVSYSAREKSIDVVVDVHEENKFDRENVLDREIGMEIRKSQGHRNKLSRSTNIGEKTNSGDIFGPFVEERGLASAATSPEERKIRRSETNELHVISAKSSPSVLDELSERNFEENLFDNDNGETCTPKRRRRRWSKSPKMLDVAIELRRNSVDKKMDEKLDNRLKCPSDTSSAFDNAAFQSDHDEVLRIVTEVGDPKESPVLSDNERGTRIKLVSLSTYSEKSTTSGRSYGTGSVKVGKKMSNSSTDENSNGSDSEIFDERENLKRKGGKSKRRISMKSKSISNDQIDRSFRNEAKKFIAVGIHRADMLEPDLATRQPMLRVHVVGIDTGNYLTIRESDDNRCKYLQPMITKPFVYREHKSVIPKWEEDLIFEYDFDRIMKEDEEPVILFLEILDLWNFSEASRNYETVGKEACWRKIAWAFLRPIGRKGVLHVNKKIRLQLYRPGKIANRPGRSKCEVFDWWKLKKLEKYPSSLYVSIRGVEPPIQEPIVYDELTLTETSRKQSESRDIGNDKRSDILELPKRIRLDAQSCKIPNDQLFRTEIFENGCFCVTFSNSGKYLACVVSAESEYPINIHAVPDGTVIRKLSGHKNFIYALNWSHDDKFLLSTSSDQTACIWDVREEEAVVVYFQMLPHPSYVYCGRFDPGNKRVVATGCYDRRTRIWARSRNSKNYELMQELEKHKGYVNSLCFQRDGGLITADSVGVVILWSMKRKRRSRFSKEWHFSRKIAINEIENIVINTIILHPLGSRLLVHSRDSGLRMLDLADGVVLRQYHGLKNQRLQTTACLSPCGGLIFCGGEDSSVNVWDLENGNHLAKYSIPDAKIVASTDYHPFDNILAFSTFGNPGSVRVLHYSKESTGEIVGLKLLANDVASKVVAKKFPPKFCSKDFEDIRLRVDSEANENRGVSLKSKMRRIRDEEENLRSKSVRKLNNIIEKIDKILLNATSRYDDLTLSSNTSVRTRRDAVWTDSEKGCDDEDSEFSNRANKLDEQCVLEMYNEKDNTVVLEVNETSFIRESQTILETGCSDKNEGTSRSWSNDDVERVKKERIDYEQDRGTRSGSKIGSPHTDDSTGTYIIEKGEDPKSPKFADSSSPSCTISTVRNEFPVPKPRKKPANK